MSLHFKPGIEEIDTEALKNHIRAVIAGRGAQAKDSAVTTFESTANSQAVTHGLVTNSQPLTQDAFFRNQAMSIDHSTLQSGSAKKMSESISSIPLLGPLLNWIFKIFALPARFYSLQQDFSNRAAWIDQHGDHIRQNQYQIISRQTQVERTQIDLKQSLRRIEESFRALQTQHSQLQAQVESRLFAVESRQNHTQANLIRVEENVQSFQTDLTQATQLGSRHNALESQLRLIEKHVGSIKTDLYSEMNLPGGPSQSKRRAAEAIPLDINSLKDEIRQAAAQRFARQASGGGENLRFPLKEKLLELQQQAIDFEEYRKQIERQIPLMSRLTEKLQAVIEQQTLQTSSLEQKVAELTSAQSNQTEESLRFARQVEIQSKEQQAIIERQLRLQSLTETTEQLQQHSEEIKQLTFDLSRRLDGADQRLVEVLMQTASLSEEVSNRFILQDAKLKDQLLLIEQQIEAAHLNDQQQRDQVRDLFSRVEGISHQTMAAISSARESRESVVHELDEIKVRMLRTERHWKQFQGGIASDLYQENPDKPSLNGNGGTEKKTSEMSTEFDYFLFEHRFRGSREMIKTRQSVYFEFFLGCQSVLDLGCGRGEFLELLKENGIPATGIDSNEDMIDLCRDNGLTVIKANLLNYLQGLPDGSIDGAFSAQVIEHISPDKIFLLLKLLARKLRPGSPLVIETVNTNCQTALSNFFLDPTHVRPVPPEMLRYMCEQNQLRPETFIFSSPVSGSQATRMISKPVQESFDMTQHLDYALLARVL